MFDYYVCTFDPFSLLANFDWQEQREALRSFWRDLVTPPFIISTGHILVFVYTSWPWISWPLNNSLSLSLSLSRNGKEGRKRKTGEFDQNEGDVLKRQQRYSRSSSSSKHTENPGERKKKERWDMVDRAGLPSFLEYFAHLRWILYSHSSLSLSLCWLFFFFLK